MKNSFVGSVAVAAAVLAITSSNPARAQSVSVVAPPTPVPPMPAPVPVAPTAYSTWTNARPASNPAEWVNADDYPKQALRAGTEGSVAFRLGIDVHGNVSDCSVTSSSGSALLDDTTCQLLVARARFTPARDRDGHFTTGSYSSRVHWVRPSADDEPTVLDRAPQPGTVVIDYTVGTDGVARDCKITTGADLYDLITVNTPCEWKTVYPPYRDSAGRPVEKRVRMTVVISFPGTAPAPRKRRGK